MTEQSPLHHLLDRMLRGALLVAERETLAQLAAELQEEVVNAQQDTEYMKLLVAASSEPGHAVRRVVALEAENVKLRDSLARCRHKPRITELEAEVARLTAGQCTHALHMCQQHHTTPVDGCPYPKCIKAREQAEACPECGDTGACNGGPCPLTPATA